LGRLYERERVAFEVAALEIWRRWRRRRWRLCSAQENGLYGKSVRVYFIGTAVRWQAATMGKKGLRSLHLKWRKQSLSTGSGCKFMHPVLSRQKLSLCYFLTLFLRMEYKPFALMLIMEEIFSLLHISQARFFTATCTKSKLA
jgi:hypothetical protein